VGADSRVARDQDVASLLTTHDMEEADRVCDSVAVIDHGRIIAEGSPACLKAGLGAENVIALRLRADAADLRAKLSNLPEVTSASTEDDGQLRVLANGGEHAVATVVQSAVRHDRRLRRAGRPRDRVHNPTGRQLRD